MKLLLFYFHLVILFFIFSPQLISSFSLISGPKCQPDESLALLKLKAELPANPTPRCYPQITKTSNWSESTNCCNWDGVACDNVTGHVIGLNLRCGNIWGFITSKSSLFSLTHLQSLDLYGNDFLGSSIVPEFGRFKNMTDLALSFSNFTGDVPLEISYLSKLVSLRIVGEIFSLSNLVIVGEIRFSAATFKALSQNLTSLSQLHLSAMDLSSVHSAHLANLSSLTSLSLTYCKLHGEISENIFRLPKLQVLDLSANLELTGHFPNSNNWTSSLQELSLSYTGLSVDLPNLHRNGISLTRLSLAECHFVNLLNGTIPSWIYQLPHLSELDLSNNNFSGRISEFRSTSLLRLSLGGNKLHGSVPRSIFQSVELYNLDLSSNSFTGSLDLKELSNLKKLFELDLSFNNLSLHFNNSINYTFPRLRYFRLSSCNISEFPNFLRSSKYLSNLDLSSNQIQGSVPKWLWDIGKDSLYQLNLSHNSLTFMEPLPWKNLQILDLRSNLFSGPIPISSAPSLFLLLGSKNQFLGEISISFCNLTSLQVLDLSYNNLTGKIPSCFSNLSPYLSVLDLRRNRLHGNIPTAFPKENRLRNLNLNGNQLEGTLPRSLMNCTNLEVLDVGNNLLNDTFPSWIESLPQLRVLVLRSNMFHGSIENPTTEFPFKGLRIMDLSDNKFDGPLPTILFENFEAMTNAENVKMEYMGEFYYQDSIMVTLKGNYIELVKIQTILTTIDFSCNNFTGEIPSLIGRLKALKGLNFSHNRLSGTIPSTLGNLANLEALDLSSNSLVGKIPPELARIIWLSSLNLSHNQLVGPIPHGSQFNTFGNKSFSENLDLCGFPLSKLCGEDMDATPNSNQEDEDSNDSNWLNWKIVWMGYACGVVIGVSSGYILLYSNGKLSWLSESVLVELAILSRKFQASFRKPKKKDQKKKRVVGSLGK